MPESAEEQSRGQTAGNHSPMAWPPGRPCRQGTNMTSARGVEGSSYRWPMLAVVSLGIVALTLNWFDVATAFPLIGAEFKVGLGSLGLLISLYIVGYGLTHIPGGVLATKIGMKRTLVLGLLVQGGSWRHVRALAQLRRARHLPGCERCRGVGVRRHDRRLNGRLVPREGGHLCTRRDRRSRLQRGSRARPLRLAVRPALCGLAHLDGPRRSVRAAGRRGHRCGLSAP